MADMLSELEARVVLLRWIRWSIVELEKELGTISIRLRSSTWSGHLTSFISDANVDKRLLLQFQHFLTLTLTLHTRFSHFVAGLKLSIFADNRYWHD